MEDKRSPNASRNWGIASIAASFVSGLLFSQYGERVLGGLFPVFSLIWPMVLIALGVFAGWQLKKWRVSVMLSNVEDSEKREITEALSCSTWINTKLIADLFFDDLRFAKEDLAAANDPLCKAGVVYTAPIEIDGRVVFRIALEPKYRALFAKHEDYFYDEVERLGKGRILIDRQSGRATLSSSMRRNGSEEAGE